MASKSDKRNKVLLVGAIALWYTFTLSSGVTATNTALTIGSLTLAAGFMNSMCILLYIAISTYLSAIGMKKLLKGGRMRDKVTTVIVCAIVGGWYVYNEVNGTTILTGDWTLGSFTLLAAFLNNIAIMTAIGLTMYLVGLATKKVLNRLG